MIAAFNFLLFTYDVGFVGPIAFKHDTVSNWLEVAQRVSLSVLKMFNRQFYVAYPKRDPKIPKPVKPSDEPLFDPRFLPFSAMERHWPGLTTYSACTVSSP